MVSRNQENSPLNSSPSPLFHRSSTSCKLWRSSWWSRPRRYNGNLVARRPRVFSALTVLHLTECKREGWYTERVPVHTVKVLLKNKRVRLAITYTAPPRDPALGLHIQPKTYQLSHVTNIIVNSSFTNEWIKKGPFGNVPWGILFQFSVRFRMWTGCVRQGTARRLEKVKNPVNGYLEKSPPNRKFNIHCTVMKESTAVVHCPNQTRGFNTRVHQSRKTLHSLHTLQTHWEIKNNKGKGER